MKLLLRLAEGIVGLSLITSLGCGLKAQKQIQPTENQTASTSDQSAVSWQTQISLLEKKITELQAQLKHINEQQERDRLNLEKRIQATDQTISLLELNLKETDRIIVKLTDNQAMLLSKPKSEKNQPSSNNTKPRPKETNSTSISKGLVNEMKIPDKSAAVEEITLLRSKKNKKRFSTNKKNTAESTSLMKKEKKGSKLKDTEPLKWEDPDLNPPISPINSLVVPGAKKRYQSAFKIFSAREYQKSIKIFEEFILRFPNDQDADNSQFWIGQSYYELGNYLQAEIAFRNVLKYYQHGETKRGFKTPDAILMLGRIYLVRDMPIKATNYFKYVLKNYPETRSAVKAKREMQAINSF